jgi:hypothetical protein
MQMYMKYVVRHVLISDNGSRMDAGGDAGGADPCDGAIDAGEPEHDVP